MKKKVFFPFSFLSNNTKKNMRPLPLDVAKSSTLGLEHRRTKMFQVLHHEKKKHIYKIQIKI